MNIIRKAVEKLKLRAIPVHMVWESAWDYLEKRSMDSEEFIYPYLHDIYLDYDEKYIVFFEEGLAYKTPFEVQDGSVIFGDASQIEFVHTPIENTRIRVRRAKDGLYEGQLVWWAVACSSVVNRSGEIDSSELFQQFESEFETYEQKPYLTFYHEQDEKFRFGEVLGVKRDGNLLLAWGTIKENHPIGNAALSTINTSGEWGLSIGYLPEERPKMFEIEENIKVPVYTRGRLIEISLLKENDAAAPFTNIKTE